MPGRKEHFVKWFAWSLNYGDCDPAVWLANYLNRRFEHNVEQRYWFAWLYGNTYYLPSSWVMLNEFPDLELADVERVSRWNSENYKRLRYQTDTKWSKGHLPKMLESYREFVREEGSQEGKFLSLCQEDTLQGNFEVVWREVKNSLFKFGRYSTWFFLQQLKYTTNLPIEPSSLMLSDFSGSKSHRNGLLLALGKDDWLDSKLTTKEYDILEGEAQELLERCKDMYPHLSHFCEPFMMETALCSFKKVFREKKGRYLGYYLDRQSEEIQRLEGDGWNGIQWEVLWQARTETLDERLSEKSFVNKGKFGEFLTEKEFSRGDWKITKDTSIRYL